MAALTSPSRWPTRAVSMAAVSARSQVSMSSRSAGAASPTMKLMALSATHPSTDAAKSRVTRSPSRNR